MRPGRCPQPRRSSQAPPARAQGLAAVEQYPLGHGRGWRARAPRPRTPGQLVRLATMLEEARVPSSRPRRRRSRRRGSRYPGSACHPRYARAPSRLHEPHRRAAESFFPVVLAVIRVRSATARRCSPSPQASRRQRRCAPFSRSRRRSGPRCPTRVLGRGGQLGKPSRWRPCTASRCGPARMSRSWNWRVLELAGLDLGFAALLAGGGPLAGVDLALHGLPRRPSCSSLSGERIQSGLNWSRERVVVVGVHGVLLVQAAAARSRRLFPCSSAVMISSRRRTVCTDCWSVSGT